MTAPFSILKFIFGKGRSSSSDGVGEGAYASGLREPSFSDSYGEGGVECDSMSDSMLDSEREQSDSDRTRKVVEGENKGTLTSLSNMNHTRQTRSHVITAVGHDALSTAFTIAHTGSDSEQDIRPHGFKCQLRKPCDFPPPG